MSDLMPREPISSLLYFHHHLNSPRAPRLELIALPGLPEIRPGDDLPNLISQCLEGASITVEDLDVFVVAQKIVSKSEGRLVDLQTISPSEEAVHLAGETSMDERLVQLILDESTAVLRKKRGVIMVLHRLGFVTANAGVDRSNVRQGAALLLPRDPDESARGLRQRLMHRFQKRLAVIVSDSMGRPWRNGTTGHALGVAGLDPLVDLRGRSDRFGGRLQKTRVGVADAISAAATLLMGEASESIPVVLVRGYPLVSEHVGIRPLLREAADELFR